MPKIDNNSKILIRSMILNQDNNLHYFVQEINDDIYTLRERSSPYFFDININDLIKGNYYLVENNL